jgi:hypothetical protein
MAHTLANRTIAFTGNRNGLGTGGNISTGINGTPCSEHLRRTKTGLAIQTCIGFAEQLHSHRTTGIRCYYLRDIGQRNRIGICNGNIGRAGNNRRNIIHNIDNLYGSAELP